MKDLVLAEVAKGRGHGENDNLVLALNCGSSSVKVSILRDRDHILHILGERLETEQSTIHIRFVDEDEISIVEPFIDHVRVLEEIILVLKDRSLLEHVFAIGHRVVHGGTMFHKSTLVASENVERIDSVSHLAPLHNPSSVRGIRLMLAKLPGIPNVAVFDTSFHATIPEKAYTYPLPIEYRKLQMRKFGFHGTSVHYVSQIATDIIRRRRMGQTAPTSSPSADHPPQREQNTEPNNMVVCHLGSGASVTAVVGGESRDTSMGFTPLAGLMMETRCGSVDPSLVGFACRALNRSVDQVTSDFNTKSGLRGMVGPDEDFDMRALLRRNDAQACLAVDMFVYRLAQNIASAMVGLDGPMDALVFTAGIGEHSDEIRRRTICALLPILPNVRLDEGRNLVHGKDSDGIISVDGTLPLLLVIPTDEEVMIAQECRRVIANSDI
ncbi:hypothetical protein ACHAW5_008941 [Stephanodiscus triporus]|uniref:Probable acetate kinase n=1 Tax=Stephanodiscus triporus TaxID=2934178 RepID=A0ABD3MZH6_9STRA